MPEVPETKYDRDLQRFNCLGLDLNRPVDSVKKGKFPYLKNIRSFTAGLVEPRYGLTDIAEVVAGQTPVHSARRLNDLNASTYTRVVGTGTHLATGQAAFTDLDSGYSGNPLALQPWRPQASPTPYMYVADSARMRKVTAGGVLDTIGYGAPNAAPGVALSNVPKYKAVDSFSATTGWTQALTAGAPSLISRTPETGGSGTTTAIAQILYDSGTTGWACVNLTSMVGVGYGERLFFDNGAGTTETATVQDVFPASKSTTIASIVYDSGTTGLCSIVLTDAIDEVAIDAMIRNSTATENARIVAVVIGPNGVKSIRVSTTGTWAITNTVAVLSTLRVYLVGTYTTAAGNVASKDAVRSSVTAGTGTLSKVSTLDLSVIASGVPAYPDDYMCIGLRVDRPDLVTELKIQLDVDAASVSAGSFTGTEFTRNFYTRSFRASDLTPSVRNLQPIITTQQTIAQRQVIDDAQSSYQDPPLNSNTIVYTDPYTGETITGDVTTQADSPVVGSQQLEAGDTQWVGLRFHISELIRVGTDDTRTLKDVVGIRVLAIVTGTVVLDMDSWWIGGGYGPDTGDTTAIPYSYRYRVRNPATNVRGNPSPAARLFVSPYRQSVAITPTQFAAPSGTNITATNLVLDIERFGGQIAEWHYAGTVPNAASPGFIDTFADDIVGGNPIMGINDYEPWPILGTPVTGTTGIVSGTSVADSGATFSTSWAMGTRILIANQPYTIYRVISTALMEIVENAGAQSGVVWRIDEPTILAQALPCLWEHDDTFFACGDLVNPGRLYWSNPGSETTQPINYRDVTSPSEPLMNGVSYNIRGYVFSSENLFQILRSTSLEAISENVASGNTVQWVSERIPNGKGLFSRWALTRNPTPVICFLSKDGIYATTGGAPTSLTDEDLYPLFPNEGNIGTTTNGVYAPNIVAAYLNLLRLEYYDEYLYFDYWNVQGGYSTLILSFDLGTGTQSQGGWFWDQYNPNVVFHYGEEGQGVHSLLVGGLDSHLYQYAGTSDNGVDIQCEISTPSLDQGDARANKLYGDIMLDADTQGVSVAATPYFNNNTSSVATVAVSTASRTLTTIPLGTAWQTYRNISLNLIFSVNSSSKPKFYIWEPRRTFESAPIAALSWEISPTSFGMEDFKHVGLVKISHVSTADLGLIFTVDGVVQPTIVITASGGIYEETIFRVPVMKGKLFKVRLESSVDFRFDTRDSFFEIKDWGKDSPYHQLRIFGDYAFVAG